MTIILLPPSETKRDGGDFPRAGAVSRFPQLAEPRGAARDALRELVAGADDAVIARALGVGQRSAATEIARNRALDAAPVMPAIDRYTGVLYDALDPATLTLEARHELGRSVAIQSALFGLLGALDPIPAYRLSAGSRLPGVR
ncbi:MAG: YaaA family protein, partial [Microcella sp.]